MHTKKKKIYCGYNITSNQKNTGNVTFNVHTKLNLLHTMFVISFFFNNSIGKMEHKFEKSFQSKKNSVAPKIIVSCMTYPTSLIFYIRRHFGKLKSGHPKSENSSESPETIFQNWIILHKFGRKIQCPEGISHILKPPVDECGHNEPRNANFSKPIWIKSN